MKLRDMILKNRSYRRFEQSEEISKDTLLELVDLARLSPSAANQQQLRFYLSNDPELNDFIYSCCSWAGYLLDWNGPKEGERPSAYIIILGNTLFSHHVSIDLGIASQSILLGAVEKGLGGCCIASVQKDKLTAAIEFPEDLEILLVIALGKPKEKVIIEPMSDPDDVRYWRDKNGDHHVPKRSLNEIIIK
ncbi:MAG TPA: nitroreductase family protein [Candidatus Cloacimonadota bacterium]|nr:nitroreductase family protein [Candidatus Cloacimonadota bacterium]HPT71958.1 nitroreductase family protein [Candidatus Cloacimonadota bacterium]